MLSRKFVFARPGEMEHPLEGIFSPQWDENRDSCVVYFSWGVAEWAACAVYNIDSAITKIHSARSFSNNRRRGQTRLFSSSIFHGK